VAASAQLEERVEVLEGQISGSMGRQDMLAGNLIEVRETVMDIKTTVDRLEVSQRDMQAWQKITDMRLDRMEEDIVEINGNVTKLNHKYDGLSKKVGDLNTKYERLDKKVDRLDKRVDGLDKKVDGLDKKVDGLGERVDGLGERVDGLGRQVEGLGSQFGVLSDDVGGLKAGQIELRDMVATLLARSEGGEQQK
jgi:chromosome segregation ATPase